MLLLVLYQTSPTDGVDGGVELVVDLTPPPTILPVVVKLPVTSTPAEENTAMLAVPLTPTVTLALAESIDTLLVPLLMLLTEVMIPDSWLPLPKK